MNLYIVTTRNQPIINGKIIDNLSAMSIGKKSSGIRRYVPRDCRHFPEEQSMELSVGNSLGITNRQRLAEIPNGQWWSVIPERNRQPRAPDGDHKFMVSITSLSGNPDEFPMDTEKNGFIKNPPGFPEGPPTGS